MGVKLTEILPSHELEFDDLKGKIIVIDGFLVLYQFLTSIRQQDGTPLLDSKGRVTSHLQGLFARTTNMMQKGIKLAFVFDGQAPILKKKIQEARSKIKKEAMKNFEEAEQEQNIELMKKYAGRTARLTPEMVEESKNLLAALGIPWVQAPSEGEAQAAAIVSNGDAYAVGTQDADALLFGAPCLIKNLTISEKKKTPNKLSFISIKPTKIVLAEVLASLEVTQDQLIAMGMLVGTDYNPGGIKGIGAKKALKLVKEHISLANLFTSVSWEKHFDFSWKEVFDTIKNIPITNEYSLKWKNHDQQEIIKILCVEHDFSQERIITALQKINNGGQQGLERWA
ncbi:MAG: flap endonuclease-1 [Nanoarchaeota archaeon]